MIDIVELNNIADGLIFDRTQADVDYALDCEINGAYTDEDLKGAYNVSDRNRVANAVNFIAGCLKDAGMFEACANVIRDGWNLFDIIYPEDNGKVLASLANLKLLLPYSGTAAVPGSLDELTYRKANAVESIAFDLYGVFLRLRDAWLYCGDGYASEWDAWNWQGWDN